MRPAKTVEIGGRVIALHELTVAEVREWFNHADTLQSGDLIDSYLFEQDGLTLADIAWLADVPREVLDELTPQEIQTLMTAIKAVNPLFFDLRRRVLEKIQALTPPTPPDSGPPSTVASSPLPATDTAMS
jgi:hypothetical protein